MQVVLTNNIINRGNQIFLLLFLSIVLHLALKMYIIKNNNIYIYNKFEILYRLNILRAK